MNACVRQTGALRDLYGGSSTGFPGLDQEFNSLDALQYDAAQAYIRQPSPPPTGRLIQIPV